MAPRPHRLVWLLRHAKTVADPPPGGTDHERALAPRGRRDADALGRRLGDDGDHLGLGAEDLPELVLCSTATRTTQTAERVLAGMAASPPVRYLRALYGASPEGVVDELRVLDDALRSVMVVGHNPTAHELAARLGAPAGSGEATPVDRRGFPTCSLAVFSLGDTEWRAVEPGRATLVGLFTPPF